jgi:2-polyprenyl-3-methyl-5-hydroxy-6-metoxy-1,4-benzoquinol methylase/glycosyltransferase involved in cell wall biosynthesis
MLRPALGYEITSERPLLIAQLDAMHSSRGGDWYYRTFAPGRAMAELPNVYVVNVDQAHRRLPQILERADVLVINGVCSADLLPVMAERKRTQRLTVFEINDDVQAMQASNPLAGFFAQPENLRLFRRLALSADAVQYSVEELERLYGSLNRRGQVFHNQLVAVPPLRTTTSQAVNLGWGGSAGHLDDIAAIAPAVMRFVQEHADVTLQLMCSERIWRLFDDLPAARKRLTPVGSIDDYYAFVSQLDIGLAPNRDAGFNRARSDVKFLEYAGFGAVPVVQRLTPYLRSVEHGQTGFLFDGVDELVDLLKQLVESPAERQRIRENAHRYASTERIQAAHAVERVDFYRQLEPRSDSAAAELFAELGSLEGAEVSGRHCLLAHSRFETLLHDGLVLLQEPATREQGTARLRDAASLEPQHPLPELFLGMALGTEQDLLSALQKNPRSVQAMLGLGAAHLAQGQFKPALQRFLTAAEIAPGYEMPFAHAAQTMQKLGAAKEAAEFERLAQSLALAVAAPPPVTPAASANTARPAWQLLDQGVHLETLNPSYAPTGLLELVAPAPRRVLDLGCFCGGTGRWLKQRFPGCEVVGIEMLEKAAAMAAEAYDRVIVGTLEQIDFEREQLLPRAFDAIIAADVLEHLFNPWQALQRLRPLLAPQGALYVSLPNVRNLKLMSDLAKGQFDYAGAGILDVTHVRFFTRQSAVQMLEQTGYAVEDVRINPDQRLAPVFEGKNLDQTTSIELDGLRLTGLTRQDLLELAALQLYLRCVPA